MRHFFALVVSAATAACSLLALVGCDSDSDGGGANGGSAGSSTSQCVANNAEFTPTEFLAQTEEGKACSDASDASSVCAHDMPLIGGNCGKGCLGMGTDAEQADCVAACIQDELKADSLSDACLACYTADIECARKKCLVPCGLHPTGDDCAACRTENGCADAFYACSGLPEPSAPAGGGSGGEGGS